MHHHGFAHDLRAWSLDGLHTWGDASRSITERAASKQIDCPECFAVFAGTRTCPECGYRIPVRGRDVEAFDGELVELGTVTAPGVDRQAFYCELRTIARERAYSPKWAAAQYRERFAEWPPFAWNNHALVEP